MYIGKLEPSWMSFLRMLSSPPVWSCPGPQRKSTTLARGPTPSRGTPMPRWWKTAGFTNRFVALVLLQTINTPLHMCERISCINVHKKVCSIVKILRIFGKLFSIYLFTYFFSIKTLFLWQLNTLGHRFSLL